MSPEILRDAIRELDLGAERVWPSATVSLESGWRCRLDQGVTRRANSVLPLDWTGQSPAASIDAVIALYRQSGLSPCFQITEAVDPPDLDDLLSARGFQREGESLVQRRPAAGSLWRDGETSPVREDFGPDPVSLSHSLEEPWLACLHREQSPPRRAVREAILRRIDRPAGFASQSLDGRVVAVGLGVLDGAVGWFNCMHTDPAARRRGCAGAILRALMAWLRDAGAEWFCLQVEADNGPARALYDAAGFESAYRYHYRVLR